MPVDKTENKFAVVGDTSKIKLNTGSYQLLEDVYKRRLNKLISEHGYLMTASWSLDHHQYAHGVLDLDTILTRLVAPPRIVSSQDDVLQFIREIGYMSKRLYADTHFGQIKVITKFKGKEYPTAIAYHREHHIKHLADAVDFFFSEHDLRRNYIGRALQKIEEIVRNRRSKRAVLHIPLIGAFSRDQNYIVNLVKTKEGWQASLSVRNLPLSSLVHSGFWLLYDRNRVILLAGPSGKRWVLNLDAVKKRE